MTAAGKANDKHAAGATAIAAAVPGARSPRTKLVRASFTMSQAEYKRLGEVKKACIGAGIEVKKGQLLRIAMAMLSDASLDTVGAAVKALADLPAARSKKS